MRQAHYEDFPREVLEEKVKDFFKEHPIRLSYEEPPLGFKKVKEIKEELKKLEEKIKVDE